MLTSKGHANDDRAPGRSGVVEYVCQDCKVPVFAFGISVAPSPPRCSVCAWLAEVPDPAERAALRASLREAAGE